MRAIIMAGGFGTRLRPLTINVPKPMAPVVGVPMMEHVVSLLVKHGITDITSLLYFKPDSIKDYFKDGKKFGVNMTYELPDDDYGTAGAVRYALKNSDEPALVISGDLVTDFDLSEALSWHKQKNAETTILLTRMDNPLAYGIVITDQDERIVRFLEKPSWGEAFSDTINTGIYILEPSAIDMIPYKENFDFSQNLFPEMLKRNMGLYGKVMTGYWKDVGNVDEYHRVHIDFYDKKLNLNLKSKIEKIGDSEIIKGNNVVIGENVQFTGRVVLGNDVIIEPNIKLHNSIIGDRTTIGANAQIKNSVLWDGNHIGTKCRFSRSIVCRNSSIGSNVQLLDNVIISDESSIGDSATVKANCKIWPGKKVDSGATVSSSMVWGEKWNRELFTNSKITGLALTEITPEMAVKVGAAFGASLGQGNSVVVSRDASDNSRLLKRGLISGLLAAGVNVSDIETLPVPVVRNSLANGNYGAGIYIRHTPEDYRLIDMIFFDGNGLDMPTLKLKKIERLYFAEDFLRASLDNIGHLDEPGGILEHYQKQFISSIDQDVINQAGFKIVIDYSNGSASQVFPTLFFKMGISATELNASLNPRKFSTTTEEFGKAIVQMSSIVSSLPADIGFVLNPAAEKLTIINEDGHPIDNDNLLLLVTDLYCQTHPSKKIAVPVSASMGVEEIAEKYNVEVVRIPNNHLSMMDIHRRGEVDFVGGTRGGFIFPGFQLGADAIFTVLKLLEMLAKTKIKLNELESTLQKYYRCQKSVSCPWSKKGTVMRMLIHNSENKKRELIDGIRIFENNGWALISPDLVTASFNILTESDSDKNATIIMKNYVELINSYQNE
ncbi:MAG: sugar phosphate nucleotidyltransferase [candidate division Zixibacteria bacterium]|nr:sugar phosphate nucleotidyltransferase [candidate division Zixibacteria bacterium]